MKNLPELNRYRHFNKLKMTKWTDLSSHIRKAKESSKVKYPLFEACAKLTDDEFWINIFLNCSKDKFPKGFLYSQGYFKYRKGQVKIFQIEVPDNPEDAMVLIKKFISEHGSLFSDIDKKIQDEYTETVSSASNRIGISEIKKNKYIFNEYLEKYIKTFDITHREALRYILNFGFEYGLLTEKDITFDTEIKDIKGIVFDQENEEYFIPEERLKSLINKKKNVSKSVKKTLEMEIWEKYLKKMLKGITDEDSLKKSEECLE